MSTLQPTELPAHAGDHAGEKMPQQTTPDRLYTPVRTDKVVASRGFYIAKIILGACILAFDVIAFGLIGGMAASYYYGDFYGLAFCFPVAIVSFLWQCAEFITLCVRKSRGIHPGAHVGMHLIIWLGAAASVGLTATVLYFNDYYEDDYYYSYSRRGDYFMLFRALIAFMALLLLLHFTLFVRACVECNRRNRATPTVMLVPAAYVATGQHPHHMSYVQAPTNAYMPGQPMAQPVPQQQQQQQQPYYDGHTSYYAPAPAHQQPQPVHHSTPPPAQGQQTVGSAV